MKNVLITVLSIIVIGLSALLVYDKFIKTDDKKENNTVDNNTMDSSQTNEISSEVLSDLYSLIGVDTTREFNYCSNINIDLMGYSGLTSSMDKLRKQEILYYYAVSKGYMTTVTGEEYNYCMNGIGEVCNGLSKENYLKIAKKYNITDDFDMLFDDFEKYNGLALQIWINLGGCSNTAKHTLNSKYVNNTIVIEDKVDYYDLDKTFIKTENVKYTFNKLSDGSYALYSVEKIN